jgi:hypothetical protein
VEVYPIQATQLDYFLKATIESLCAAATPLPTLHFSDHTRYLVFYFCFTFAGFTGIRYHLIVQEPIVT